MLRGENATARNLHSLVQSLESDKLKLELKVKNLEQKLRESQKSPSGTSGKACSGAFAASLLSLLASSGLGGGRVSHTLDPLSSADIPLPESLCSRVVLERHHSKPVL